MEAVESARTRCSDGLFPCCRVCELIQKGDVAGIEAPDTRGKTPLQYAAFMGHNDCLNTLVGAGADVNAQNPNGSTALHFAAMSMMPGAALSGFSKLAEAGCDPNITNVAGKMCLDVVKDPSLRTKLQGIIGVAAHEYKGRKTLMERQLDGEPNTSDEEEDEEELDDDDSEWDEYEWEWEEGDEEDEEDGRTRRTRRTKKWQ